MPPVIMHSIYDQFVDTTLEDSNVPPANERMGYEAFEENIQRHKLQRSSTSKTAANTSRIIRITSENVTMENVGDKLGGLVMSIDPERKKTWMEKLSIALWSMEGYNDTDMEIFFTN